MYLEIIKREPVSSIRPTPILFIHGAWHGAWCWDKSFLPYFAENGYISHALSLRGHGASDGSERLHRITIREYVEDVEQVVNSFSTPPILVGHSMGGLVVQKYLEKHQSPAAVLLAPVPIKGVLKTTFRFLKRHPLNFIMANLTFSLYKLVRTPELAREVFFSPTLPKEKLLEYFDNIQDESYIGFLNMLVPNIKPQVANVENMLVLGADNDVIFHRSEIEETSAAWNTEPVFFTDMSHDMQLEDEWRKVADFILNWLKDKNL